MAYFIWTLQQMRKTKHITLKHLLIDGRRQIGLQFYPDKVIEALVNQLPILWSEEFGMTYLENTPDNLDLVLATFKGVLWLNGQYFFANDGHELNEKAPSINSYRQRKITNGYRVCPEEYLQKLEIRKYSLNTAKSYIAHFEKFINHYKSLKLLEISENEIKSYISFLINNGLSDSYVNQSINSIKFYYEMVLGMPNRFYSVERPIKSEKSFSGGARQEALWNVTLRS